MINFPGEKILEGLLDQLGYRIASIETSYTPDNFISTIVRAYGLSDAEMDHEKVINFLSKEISVVSLSINKNYSLEQTFVVGQKSAAYIKKEPRIELDLVCYIDTIVESDPSESDPSGSDDTFILEGGL